MDTKNKQIILADITNDIVIKLQERISNINSQIDLLENEQEKQKLKSQIIAYEDSIRIVNNIFMEKI